MPNYVFRKAISRIFKKDHSTKHILTYTNHSAYVSKSSIKTTINYLRYPPPGSYRTPTNKTY